MAVTSRPPAPCSRRWPGAIPPRSGRREAAFAGALAVGLGGVNVYGGRTEVRPRIGAGAGGEPGIEDLRRAVRLSRATGWASTAACAALAFAITGLRRRPPHGHGG